MDVKITSFDQLIEYAKGLNDRLRYVIVAANEEGLLEAAMKSYKDCISIPTLIGDEKFIKEYYDSVGFDHSQFAIFNETDVKQAAKLAVDLVKSGVCECVMKGEIKTADLMKTILDPENDLLSGNLLSAFSIRELPHYHKLLGFADTGVCIYPTIEQKCKIIENSINVLHSLGFPEPKVAAVCGIEYINPKMKETLEAAELKELNKEGKISDCIVEGPISYDLAVSERAAKIKGYSSPVAADADLILFPDLASGNLTTKALEMHADVKGAAMICGAKIPIIFGSRASTVGFRYRSIALCSVYMHY